VVVGTFVCYILTMIGQKTLRPTVVSVYNYVQPMVSVLVSVLMGLGVMKVSHAIAVVLVFAGVRLVTKSKGEAPLSSPEGDTDVCLQSNKAPSGAVGRAYP